MDLSSLVVRQIADDPPFAVAVPAKDVKARFNYLGFDPTRGLTDRQRPGYARDRNLAKH